MINILERNDASLFGRLEVRLKLAIGFSTSCAAVLLDSLPALLLLTLISCVIFLSSKPTASQTRLVFFLFAFVFWGVMLSQALFYNRFPRDALITFIAPNALFRDGLCLYLQGLRHGAVQSLRMISVGFCGYAVCFSTEPDDFLKGFVALKVPFSLAFMAVSAIQFIPVAAGTLLETRTAMRLKGYRPFRRGFGHTVKTEIGALRAVLAGTIRQSEEKALSIVTRGFDMHTKRTALHENRMKTYEHFLLVCVLTAVVLLTAIKTLFWLYQNELWSASSLRGLYAFVREWL